MTVDIPEFCLFIVVSATGTGAADVLARHFAADEIVRTAPVPASGAPDESSEDVARAVAAAAGDTIAARLAARKMAAIDATLFSTEARAHLRHIAKRYHASTVVLVVCPHGPAIDATKRDAAVRALARTRKTLSRLGFREIHALDCEKALTDLTITRHRVRTDRRDETGPFDIIGDVHGCADELEALLDKLGYTVAWHGEGPDRQVTVRPPRGRRVVFVGDFTDRGPRNADVLRLVMAMAHDGHALAVPGNHDVKLLRWLRGTPIKLSHGLEDTVAELEAGRQDFRDSLESYIAGLVSHLWLDGGRLAVAHAGIKQSMIGRTGSAVRSFCLYGDTAGETDRHGLPVRYDWAARYAGEALVVYGHTPVPDLRWLNNTVCIDTACVFGGHLTALRYPERAFVQVPARKTYARRIRPLAHPPPRPELPASH